MDITQVEFFILDTQHFLKQLTKSEKIYFKQHCDTEIKKYYIFIKSGQDNFGFYLVEIHDNEQCNGSVSIAMCGGCDVVLYCIQFEQKNNKNVIYMHIVDTNPKNEEYAQYFCTTTVANFLFNKIKGVELH